MKVSIICPLYNAQEYVEPLYMGIKTQVKVDITEIKFILTECKDKTEHLLKKMSLDYEKIKVEEFSHSLVREKAAINAKGDVIVFITQDIKIIDQYWLYNLVKDIDSGVCDAAFSRQIGYAEHTVEKYTREINYPEESRVVSKGDIDKLGLMTFFFSDASSAISKKVFIELNGYDNKNLPTNEDMYFAYKLIMNEFKIKYESNSKVIHSHNLTFKETYNRYKDIGEFFAQNSYLEEYSAGQRGKVVLLYIIKRALQDKSYITIWDAFINFSARLIGMRAGKRVGRG